MNHCPKKCNPTFILSNSDSTPRHWLVSSPSTFSPQGDKEWRTTRSHYFCHFRWFQKTHTESLLVMKKAENLLNHTEASDGKVAWSHTKTGRSIHISQSKILIYLFLTHGEFKSTFLSLLLLCCLYFLF